MTAWKWLAVGVLSSTALAQTPAPTPASATAEMPSTAMDTTIRNPGRRQLGAAGGRHAAPGTSRRGRGRAPAETGGQPGDGGDGHTGNGVVTREVAVPEGKGLIELVVTPLPPETIRARCTPRGRWVPRAQHAVPDSGP